MHKWYILTKTMPLSLPSTETNIYKGKMFDGNMYISHILSTWNGEVKVCVCMWGGVGGLGLLGFVALLCHKGSHRWQTETSQLTLSSQHHFFLLLSYFCCLTHFPLWDRSPCPQLQRLPQPKTHYHISLWTAFGSATISCSTELIWFGTLCFVYFYIIVWAIYAASTLESSTLNTNLCGAAVLLLLLLHTYLQVLDGFQIQIYGCRLE